MQIRKRKVAVFTAVQLAGISCILLFTMAASKCDSSHAAANAVNKYANSLSAVQKAVIQAKANGQVDAATDIKIEQAIVVASHAGRNLDTAIGLALQGASTNQYIDAANGAFQDLVGLLKSNDPATQQALDTVANASAALLKNAISLVLAIKPANQSSIPVHHYPYGLWLLGCFLPMMAAAGASTPLSKIVSLLNNILTLEPVAVDLIVNLAQNLQGKTTDQIIAMNEQLFGTIEQTAASEIAADQAQAGNKTAG